MRYARALILLFIAPSAWGQSTVTSYCSPTSTPEMPNCFGVETLAASAESACVWPPDPNGKLPSCETLVIKDAKVWTKPQSPSCEPGWSLVMDTSQEPQCALVIKEPIYK